MSEERKLVIIGGGGFGAEALWVAEDQNSSGMNPFSWKIVGFGDDNPDLKGADFAGYSVMGTTEELCRSLDPDTYFYCAVGNNRKRARVARIMLDGGFKGATLIHPSVVMHRTAVVGQGTYVGAGSVIAPGAKIGDFVLINTLAGIGHDSLVGDFSQVCPGAKVNGECRIDGFAFIGSNASVQPKRTVGSGATVGANSFVVRSVASDCVVQGVPARITVRPQSQRS